ncbi:hypothetical protein P5673_028477 [Acropora cervicornis]|uniref:Uncharacterized protein n=1 Tax=Acropora cervicornis TaxID=6130 RepID=A0AAD9PXB3_ACRCE|nr:hypothetical protein P5673_028477 [Acropora cervicornis]
MHQKNATFDIKPAKFAASDKTRCPSTLCKAPSGEGDCNDDEFDKEFPQNHEFRAVACTLQSSSIAVVRLSASTIPMWSFKSISVIYMSGFFSYSIIK